MDYALDGSKMQPDGDDYKLVFISSDSSSKESNSDIEFALEDCDWDYFESTVQKDKKKEEPPPPLMQQQIPAPTPALLAGGSFGEVTSVLDRQWSFPPTDMLRLRHPCENCGFDSQHLLHGMGANFIPIPYPVPVPIAVPVPFAGKFVFLRFFLKRKSTGLGMAVFPFSGLQW
jgi:hypothetical protein